MKTVFVRILLIASAFCAIIWVSTGAAGYGYSDRKTIKGEGPVIEKKFDLGAISGVSLAISADVYLTQGDNREVRITGQENILGNLDLKNEESVLKIGFKENVSKCEPVKIYITLATIELMKISGSGDIKMVNHFNNLKDLKMGISGSGNIEGDLDGEKIQAGISGSGNITLRGKGSSLDFSITGSGNLNAKGLKAEEAEISIAGSGNASVNVSRNLDGRVSGSGDIAYMGDPTVNFHKAGSGGVHKIR